MTLGWQGGGNNAPPVEIPETYPDTAITITDVANNFPEGVNTLDKALENLFTSVDDGKALLKTTVIGKGGTVSQAGAAPTFNELNAGILSISGVKVASGTSPTTGTNSSYQFRDAGLGDTLITQPFFQINTLNFEPKVILAFRTGGSTAQIEHSRWVYNVTHNGYNAIFVYNTTNQDAAFRQNSDGAYVNATGFRLPVTTSSATYTWLAIGWD